MTELLPSQGGSIRGSAHWKSRFYSAVGKAVGWDEVLPRDRRTYWRFCLMLYVLVASYWIGMCTKNGIFAGLAGLEWDPEGKLMNLVALVPMTMFYNFIYNKVGNLRTFATIVLGYYSILFCVLAFVVSLSIFDPSLSIPDNELPETKYLIMVRWLAGMICFVLIDTYVAVTGTLFWSVVSFLIRSEHSPAVYPVLVVCGQLGAVTGSAIIATSVQGIGFSKLFLFITGVLILLIKLLHSAFQSNEESCALAAQEKEKELQLLARSLSQNSLTHMLKQEAQEQRFSISKDQRRLPSTTQLSRLVSHPPANRNSVDKALLEVPRWEPASVNERDNVAGTVNERRNPHGLVCDTTDANNNNTDTNIKIAVSPRKTKSSRTGLLEGLSLIFSRKFVFALAIVSTFPEFINTVLTFQMKLLARSIYVTPEEFSSFLALYGMVTNTVGIVFAFTGTRFIIRTISLQTSIIGLPFAALLVGLSMVINPVLWISFSGVVIMKSMTSSINTPAKEMLYVHCSQDIKMKAKSWIDMFGVRFAKAAGASMNIVLVSYSERAMFLLPVFIGFFALWIYMCLFLDKQVKLQSAHTFRVQ